MLEELRGMSNYSMRLFTDRNARIRIAPQKTPSSRVEKEHEMVLPYGCQFSEHTNESWKQSYVVSWHLGSDGFRGSAAPQ